MNTLIIYADTYKCRDDSACCTNIKLPLKMQATCYSVLRTAPCAPAHATHQANLTPNTLDTSCPQAIEENGQSFYVYCKLQQCPTVPFVLILRMLTGEGVTGFCVPLNFVLIHTQLRRSCRYRYLVPFVTVTVRYLLL